MKTIKSGKDISLLFREGMRVSAPGVNLIVLEHGKQHDREGRVAFIAGKKQGNAVWRNGAKRRMRSICREIGGPFDNYDVIFMAKRALLEKDYAGVVQGVRKALQKNGILKYE